MGALLGLLAAVGYGASDFVAGLASRRSSAILVAALSLGVEFLAACVATILFNGSGPTANALLWGAIIDVGSAVGTLARYHGLAVGRMSTVATTSGVLTAVNPVIVGVALGNHLLPLAALGIATAVPAVGLASWTGRSTPGARRGGLFAVIAGVSFALLFIALEGARTGSGAWPLVSG